MQGLISNVSFNASGGFLVASFSRLLAATSVESAVVLGRDLRGDVNMNWLAPVQCENAPSRDVT